MHTHISRTDRAFPVPYTLMQFAGESEEVNWQAEVWAGGGLIDLGGYDYHYASILESKNDVVVVGIGGMLFYVEGYERETGVSRFRFCSLWGPAIGPH